MNANPDVATAYPAAVPFSPAERTVAAEQGPKCGDCGKPYKLPGDMGGCGCPRFRRRKGELTSHKTMQLRTLEAAERLNQLIEVYLKANGVEVPPPPEGTIAATGPAARPEPTGVAAVDAIRAKHAATATATARAG